MFEIRWEEGDIQRNYMVRALIYIDLGLNKVI